MRRGSQGLKPRFNFGAYAALKAPLFHGCAAVRVGAVVTGRTIKSNSEIKQRCVKSNGEIKSNGRE
jgi:hypothetical protein